MEPEVLNLSGAPPFFSSNPRNTQLPNWMSYEPLPISMRLTHSVINEFGALRNDSQDCPDSRGLTCVTQLLSCRN